MRAVRPLVTLAVVFGAVLLGVGESRGQLLGTFPWQFSPFCNVVTLTVVQQGPALLLSGFDNDCGSTNGSAAAGTLVVKPGGAVDGNLTIFGPGGLAITSLIQLDPSTGSGVWTDNFGNSGALVFNPAAPSGAQRPVVRLGSGSPWSQPINVPGERFIVLASYNNEAVYDKETGLVWEKSPTPDVMNFFLSHARCNGLKLGGRMGWRLPGLHELATLVDLAVPSPGPTLPPGHPFTNIPANITANYTSANASPGTPTAYSTVTFFMGDVGGGGAKGNIGSPGGNRVWCVRGGQGVVDFGD